MLASGSITLAGLFCGCFYRRRLGVVLALFVFAAIGALSGCGSGFAPEKGPYLITVTATSGDSATGVTVRTAVVSLTIGGKP
jgi:hypothetical protein